MRRVVLAALSCLVTSLLLMPGSVEVGAAEPPVTAINHDPQLFVDDYLVDNRWGVQYLTETVVRVFHQPRKDERNPVIKGTGGYINVARDERTGLFRMWYQEFWRQSLEPNRYTYAIAYAESEDGIQWKLPRIGKHDFKGTRDNNIVLVGPSNGRAETQWLLDVPEEQRRGYRYIMLYNTNVKGERGLHLIGSHDGIDWDRASDMLIAPDFTPDTHSSIVWDPQQQKYVCFTRATNIYPESGQRRKVARLEHSKLWDRWPIFPENVMLPDELDSKTLHHKFYGMPVQYYAGIYWGFLWPYRPNEDIYTDLTFSRDGRNFQRLAERPRLIDLGPGNTWDDGMVLGSGWLEVGDEWWIYYSGADGPHAPRHDPLVGIGLARLRKEGFVSLRSPAGGGYVVTRLLRWPGGKLYVNADAGQGELTVKVTDYDRKPIANFDAQPSLPAIGNSTRHEVKWKNGDISDLKGRAIRIEFFMKNVVDLYSFQASLAGQNPPRSPRQ